MNKPALHDLTPPDGGTVVTLTLPVAGPPAIETAAPAEQALQRA